MKIASAHHVYRLTCLFMLKICFENCSMPKLKNISAEQKRLEHKRRNRYVGAKLDKAVSLVGDESIYLPDDVIQSAVDLMKKCWDSVTDYIGYYTPAALTNK